MKCRYCGAEVPKGELYCKRCGKEVCIVPDYNPLDDMLTAQIKLGVNDEPEVESDYLDLNRNKTGKTSARRTTGNMQGSSSRRSTTDRMAMDRAERERRRRQAEKKKEILRKKRRRLLMILAGVLIAIIALCVVIYQNSYAGVLKKGYKATQNQEYDKAIESFEKAIGKNQEKPDAYTGLSKVYILQGKMDKAEEVFLTTIEQQPKNSDLYEACIMFYLDTDQPMEIPLLLDEASESIQKKLSDYIIEQPSYSLDDEEVYDDVQQLSLESNEDAIYYTVDGTDPDPKSKKYTEPIQLSEGETVVKAISVNKDGVPSMISKKTYVVEFPIEDAPAVSPSTGQYDELMKIEVKVPEGYEAYYTMNGDNPTTASKKYTGPINMPEGETLFKVVLVNAKGRMSGITTRNYMLEIEQE